MNVVSRGTIVHVDVVNECQPPNLPIELPRGAYVAAGAPAAGAAYYGYRSSGCSQRVDAYGRVYTQCP
jgi:hypothetical protein